MGWQDRDYASERGYYGSTRRRAFRGSGMSAYDVVTKIIIANAVVFFLVNMTDGPFSDWLEAFGIMRPDWVWRGEIWRLITATYMHANFMHIFMNMLVLYFIGPLVEHRWGGKQFFFVYTLAGVAGNLVLTVSGAATATGAINFIQPDVYGVGASGSVMGVFGAAAVLYPRAEVLVYFLVPVRLSTLAILYTALFVWNIYKLGANYGGDLCHLAGIVYGIWWARSGAAWWYARRSGTPRPGWFSRVTGTFKSRGGGSFQKGVEQRKADAATIDRILGKVYEKGIHSLSPEERRSLTEASDRMKQHEERAGRVDRL